MAYLPLHMISPSTGTGKTIGLLSADPNYVNFGPTSPTFNAPSSGWLPWSDGYSPENVPHVILKGTNAKVTSIYKNKTTVYQVEF